MVLRLYTLINGVETLLGELTDYSPKAISEFLATDIVTNMDLLKGQTLVYRYSDQIPKSHLAEISKTVATLKFVYGYTSTKGEEDKTLNICQVVRHGDYTANLKLMLPHLSDDKIGELSLEAEKIQKAIATLNKHVNELQPVMECPFTLYHKDSTKLKN